MLWFLFFVAVLTYCAYKRLSLQQTSVAVAVALLVYGLFGGAFGSFLLLALLGAAVLVPLNLTAFRQEWITRPAFDFFARVLPEISETERTALDAGTVWWEGDLFSGQPDFSKLLALPAPKLTEAEQAFLDGPVQDFCAMLDEWQITHVDQDLPDEAWAYLKKNRFWGMIIPRQYGGLEFSAYAHSCVLARVASSAGGATAASIVAVPNSLGPAELLMHYGTQDQKDHYLPRLATGEEIPCFGLTSAYAGSDAGAIPDFGIVCKDVWKGKEVLGMRLTFDKRYITLAPVATVIGLAFKLYDPDQLLGDKTEYGITCALIPRDTPGLKIGRRHFPLNNPFQNGPLSGENIFVPIDFIIGGAKMAGQGWRMLMECLAVGRSISLPSNSTGTALMAAYSSGAYARIRRQFNIPIGQFEGIAEALAGIGGRAYACEAVRVMTAGAVDLGAKPSVPSAIAKYHCTEMSQEVAKLAMDVHAGKGVMLGPSNWIARNFQGTPIAITVEGANILTRNMMIFGQGAIRCHPYVLQEIAAVAKDNKAEALEEFDRAFMGHVGHVLSAAARALVLGLSFAWLAPAPGNGPMRRHYQQAARYAAAFALMADAAMALLGGQLKFRESISARLGDVLAKLYIASAALKKFEDDGRPGEDAAFVDWVCTDCWHTIEQRIDGVLRHLPNALAAGLLRVLIFPLGRWARPPRDALGQTIATALQEPGPLRSRLFAPMFRSEDRDTATGLLRAALDAALDVEALEKRVLKATRDGLLSAPHPLARVREAEKHGLLNADETQRLLAAYELSAEVCKVDDFDSEDLQAGAGKSAAKPRTGKPRKKKADSPSAEA